VFRARGAVVSGQSILFGSTEADTPISLSAVQKLFDELPTEMQPEALRYLEYLKTVRNEPQDSLTGASRSTKGANKSGGAVVLRQFSHRKSQS
jgi:hypothetical protein